MDADELVYAGAARQAELIAAGDVSAREVVETTLKRIESVDPQLNAFRVVFAERALMEADQADARRKAGEERPLLGVPVAIKDDVDIAGEATAWGTAAHAGPKDADAEVVRRLRSAGAVVVGKTNVPELTMSPATETITFGATRNPWDVGRTPGGSSGGSASAVAAGLCGVALGSDGAGSIRAPACWCGLVGLKPQRDRVPLAPHDDAWQGMSVNGPLGRTVADVALFMDATADDPPDGGFVAAAKAESKPLRVAVSTKLPPGAIVRIGADERRAVQVMADRLRALGHDVFEQDPDYAADLWGSAYVRVMRGIADDVRDYMPHAERLEQRTQRIAAIGAGIPWALVQRARRREAEQARRIVRLFEDADVLLTPGCARGPYRAGEFLNFGTTRYILTAAERIPYFAPFNVTGQPALAVPAGRDEAGMPVGVQLVGRPRDEATLLALGAQIEAEQGWGDQRPALQ